MFGTLQRSEISHIRNEDDKNESGLLKSELNIQDTSTNAKAPAPIPFIRYDYNSVRHAENSAEKIEKPKQFVSVHIIQINVVQISLF